MNVYFEKWTIPGIYFVYFVFSNKHYNLNIKYNWRKIHGAGIRTHDLQDMRLPSKYDRFYGNVS